MRALAEEQGFPTDHGDLRALLDHLGIGKAHLLGLGRGANIIVDFALGCPNRTSALVLVSTPHVWGNEAAVMGLTAQWSRGTSGSREDNLARSMSMAAAMLRTGDATLLIEAMLEDASYVPSREPARRKLRQLLAENAKAIIVQRGRRFTGDFSTAGRLSEIGLPTLVVHGEKDLPPVEETARLLERSISGVQRVSLPDTGRLVNMDRPEEFNRLVLEFLKLTSYSRRRWQWIVDSCRYESLTSQIRPAQVEIGLPLPCMRTTFAVRCAGS